MPEAWYPLFALDWPLGPALLARSESLVPMPLALSSTGVASFDFDLVVPEAPTGLLLALGLTLLSTARRR